MPEVRQRRDPARRLRQLRSAARDPRCLVEGLREAGLPEGAITLVPTRDRAAVGLMLRGLEGGIDVIVPRGGKSLVARVEAEARVPVFAHLEGVNHVYVDRGANLDMAKSIVLNAKMRRTGVCGAAETLLVDRAVAATRIWSRWSTMLIDAGCEVRGDAGVQAIDARVKPATDEDWVDRVSRRRSSRRGSSTASMRRSPISDAYGSHHTDAIVTEDAEAAEEIPERGRFGDRAAQRLDAVRRRRRVRLRRRDRHRHRQIPRPRPGRSRAADDLQIPRARHRADAAVTIQPRPHAAAASWQSRRASHRLIPTACASACSAARSIRRTRRIARISLFAMKRLKLDRVWWLLTPGNPLKDTARLAAARAAIAPRALRRRRSAHRRQLSRSCHRHPLHLGHDDAFAAALSGVRFVWIMGADNLRSSHRWQNWRRIAALVPIAVIDRVGPSLLRQRLDRGAGVRPLPHSRAGCGQPRRPEAASLGLPARA